jgi:GRAS domain family
VIAPVIINLIACEGSDWLERPETYKKWQLRNIQAGFEQLPLDLEIVNECKKKLRNGYDKRFFIEEDGNWMLHGWKGKIRHAFSTWKPKADNE